MRSLMNTNSPRSLVQPDFWSSFDMNDLFEDLNWLRPFRRSGLPAPAVNVSEDEKNFTIEVLAPGFKKEDFKISTDNDVLTISAETKAESKEVQKEYRRREYSFGSFTRTFNLPANAKAQQIEARYVDGVLELTIPKDGKEPKQVQTIQIK